MSFCLNCLNEYHEASWSDLYAGDSLCPSCYGKFKPRLEGFSFLGHRAYVLYEYSDFFKTALYRFKGCSDIAMAPVFLCKSALFLRLFWREYEKRLDYLISLTQHTRIRDFDDVSRLLLEELEYLVDQNPLYIKLEAMRSVFTPGFAALRQASCSLPGRPPDSRFVWFCYG